MDGDSQTSEMSPKLTVIVVDVINFFGGTNQCLTSVNVVLIYYLHFPNGCNA